MIIYDLLTKNKKNLNFLGKSEKNIEIVDKMFTEFKKHNISVDDLKNVKLDDKYTNLKLNDMIVLYEKYQETIQNKYIDENDSLTILGKNIKYSKMFENSSIYFDEFFGFTPQEYVIFEELTKKCDEISVTVCLDKIESDLPKESDIFYFNRKYAKKLLEISERQNCKLNLVNLDESYRFKNEELAILEQNLSGKKIKYEGKTENIELFLASNPYSEVENVAKTIYDLVKFKNYQYNEIGIIVNEIENYSEDAKAIFKTYDIPIFIDEKKELNQNILIQYVISLLDIFTNYWSFDSVFQYLKIGLLDIDYYDICLLENYCKKWGIKGSKWYSREFDYEPLNDLQEKLEAIRKNVIGSLREFQSVFMQNKTASELTKNIYQFLIDQNVINNLDKKIKQYGIQEVSNEYNTSYKILVTILEEISELFENEKMTFEKYKDLLLVAINNSELGKIPATQDQVILGDIDRTRSNKIQVLFVLGMNDGEFPKANKQEGYLNDNDRLMLENSGIELAKTSIDSIYESQFNIYRTLTIPEKKLFLSYCSSDKEGKSIRPSIVLKKIKRAFPNLTQKSNVISKEYTVTNEKATFEEALQVYKNYLDGEEISETWKELLIYYYQKDKKRFSKAISGMNYTNKAQKISSENIKKMYGNTLITTISRLENYRKCPFSFHMTYGLKLKETQEFQMTSLDTGSFMHEVIDRFFEYLDEKELDLKLLSDEEIKDIVNNIINEILGMSKYYIFSSSAKFRIMTKRLKKVVFESMQYIIYSLKNSDFKPFGHELEFGQKSDYKPINLKLDSGEDIEITGKIDRVDIGKLNDKKYVRIIDYKSQIKKIDLNQVVAGLQIQLITYLDAITEQENFDPAGTLYLGLIDNIIKSNKNLSDEEIEKEIRKGFKMQGLVLADVNVIKMMDNKLQTGYSDIIPVYLNKDGEITNTRSSTIEEQDFEKLQKQVKKIIKELSKEILDGNISIKPYYYRQKTGCDYCKYHSICMFNNNIKGNDYDYIKQQNNNDILNNIDL